MPKYKMLYSYSGSGKTIIEADNQEEAEEMFYDGDYSPDDEENFSNDIIEIEEINNE
jgi:hypothetical protein